MGSRGAVRLKAAIKAKWTEHRKTALPTAVPQSGYYNASIRAGAPPRALQAALAAGVVVAT